MSAKQENVKWVDGLRGFASVLVVFTHLVRSHDEDLFKPTSAEGAAPRIAQLPIIRILFQGRIGVMIFCMVTGYVCALKPIRQCRAGNHNAAFAAISKGAFRRIPRLFLPTTIATVTIWFFCQLGAFEVGNRVDSWWLNFTSPNMSIQGGLWEAIKQLVFHIITTWTVSFNIYDANQWTLPVLLKGAMQVYLLMAATAYTKPKYRMMISLAFYTFYYISNDSHAMQFFFGVFLSDLAQYPSHIAWCQARRWTSRILAPVLIFTGLILASYPEDRAEWMRWSEILGQWSPYFFPAENETPRYYSAVGLNFLALGIHFSPATKDFLSHKYLLWFGKNSFAVYLLHGALMRTILVWMLFGTKLPPDVTLPDGKVEPGKLPQPGSVRYWIFLPIWLVLLYSAANLWTKYVDPWCGRRTENLVNYVFEDSSEESSVEKERLLPQ